MISDYNYSKQTYDFMFPLELFILSFCFFFFFKCGAFTIFLYSCSHINRFKYLIAIKSGLVNQTFWKANCTLWLWCITICISNMVEKKKHIIHDLTVTNRSRNAMHTNILSTLNWQLIGKNVVFHVKWCLIDFSW